MIMLLDLLIFLPLVGALAVGFTPRGAVSLQRGIALLTTLVVAVLSLVVWGSHDLASLAVDKAWFTLPGSQIDVGYRLGVDGISLLMVVLTGVLMPIVILSTFGHITERVKEFMIWVLVMQMGMMGVFLATDLVLFYFFWEIGLVPLYFMVGIWGGKRRLYATLKFFLYTFAGSVVMLIAAIALVYKAQSTDIAAITDSMAALGVSDTIWLFAAFTLAFAIKVPVLPFHTWLPDAHTEAPTSGSVILAGVLLKMGTYGFLRFSIAMFPAAAVAASPYMMALGAIGIVYGAFLAMAQTDIKRLVACSSVSHLGYVVLGLFALTRVGLAGSLIQMVNHGLSTGLLFLLVGMIYERRHTRQLDQYGGIASVMPIYAIFWTIAVLSSVGLPGLNGFVGEYLILLGAFEAIPFWAVVSVTGVIFGAIYLLMATRKLLYGPVVHEANRKLTDLNLREIGLMVPVVVLIVWIGVKPSYFLDRTEASVATIVERLDQARDGMQTAQLPAVKGGESR
ncbi:MAG: NADH-quinone oxidoreductase subunit M [Planctomycetes bacterium]|nr:NADH-quinone oxidoreductase subunit M [Planctomycetota bacterium]